MRHRIHITPTPSRNGGRLSLPPTSPGSEMAAMTDSELAALRAALARALGDLRLGSAPSRLLGRLSRQARAEQRRRARQTARPPRAA